MHLVHAQPAGVEMLITIPIPLEDVTALMRYFVRLLLELAAVGRSPPRGRRSRENSANWDGLAL